jgi:hypothetical protein
MNEAYLIIARERVRHFRFGGVIDSDAIDEAIDLLNGVLEYQNEGCEGIDDVSDAATEGD